MRAARQRAVGVDAGGTTIAAGLVERDGTLARVVRRPTPLDSTESFLAAAAGLVEAVRDESVGAVGIGLPSAIDQRTGQAVFSVNVPLAGVDVRAWATEVFGLPAAVDNDGNCAALAEWLSGAGRGATDMVMLTLGTGIGGGLILGGRPYRGWIGAAAEVGHVVVDLDGAACQGFCGGRGHLEGLASGLAAGRIARSLFGPEADSRTLVQAARGGDPRAAGAIRELARTIGAGVATLVNVLNPELVVIGGGFGEAFDLLLPWIEEVVRRDGSLPAREVVRIVPAGLGPDAGVIGAGLLGFEALDAAPSAAGA